jgi:hypothetical protein
MTRSNLVAKDKGARSKGRRQKDKCEEGEFETRTAIEG